MKRRGQLIVLAVLIVTFAVLQFALREEPAAPAVVAGKTAAAPRGGARASLSAIPDSLLQVKERKPDSRGRAAARRNIFEYGRRAAPPPTEVAMAPPPAPPPPPPAPLRFYGFAERSQGGRRQIFLTDGEEVYLAAEGDVVLRRYRVLRVGNQSIELEELSGKQRWVVPLEQP
jgi:hypothetical protein